MTNQTKHDVKFSIPERKLGKNDVEFRVKRYSKPLGRLLVSKGGVEWVTSGKQKGKRKSWRQVLEFFEPPVTNHRIKSRKVKQIRGGGAQEKTSAERPVPSLYDFEEPTVERL